MQTARIRINNLKKKDTLKPAEKATLKFLQNEINNFEGLTAREAEEFDKLQSKRNTNLSEKNKKRIATLEALKVNYQEKKNEERKQYKNKINKAQLSPNPTRWERIKTQTRKIKNDIEKLFTEMSVKLKTQLKSLRTRKTQAPNTPAEKTFLRKTLNKLGSLTRKARDKTKLFLKTIGKQQPSKLRTSVGVAPRSLTTRKGSVLNKNRLKTKLLTKKHGSYGTF